MTLLRLALVFALALPPAAAEVREVGTLRLDGVPEIPPEVSERAAPYAQVRSAGLWAFEPDGSLLIGTRFGETTQLHRVRGPGMDREQLTFFADRVNGALVDPADPSGVYLSMDVGGGEWNQLWWLDRTTGRRVLLTDGTSKNDGAFVPRAGGKLYYFSTARNGTDFDLWVVDAHDPGRRRPVKELAGSWRAAAVTPDGGRMVLERYLSATESELWLYETGSGAFREVRPLDVPVRYRGAAFAPDGVSLIVASDEGADVSQLARLQLDTGARTVLLPGLAWDVEGVAVSPDQRWLGYTVNEGGRSRVWVGEARRPDRARPVELPQGVSYGMAFDPLRPRLAVTLSTGGTAGDVWTVDLPRLGVTRWTHSELGGLDPARFVEPALVEYPSFDGRKIPAWFSRPPGSARVPVVVLVHGGPEAQTRAGFSAWVQYLVAELGVAVLQPNVRGSTGYGRAYTLLDNGLARFASVKDLGALLDWIAARPDLDAGRVAVQGGSYGGFMVLASMVEFGDRLRCGVDMVGISSFVTFLERTEDYRRDLRRAEYGDERVPEVRAWMERTAPLANAARITRPLLVGQGRNDPRVPYTEAEQIVSAVRGNGGTAWYVIAEDEGHGFTRLSNREAWQDVVSVFYREHLLGP